MSQMIKDKSYCYECNKETLHTVLFSEHELNVLPVFFKNDEIGETKKKYTIIAKEYNVVKCNGCDKMHFVNVCKAQNEDFIVSEIPSKPMHVLSDYIFYLDKKYIQIYSEVQSAINNNLLMLACMGIRTIIDLIMQEKIGDKGSFKDRMQKMLDGHYLSQTQYDIFLILIDAGNASAHRGYIPTKDGTLQLLEALDSFLRIEVDSKIINTLKDEIPKRK